MTGAEKANTKKGTVQCENVYERVRERERERDGGPWIRTTR